MINKERKEDYVGKKFGRLYIKDVQVIDHYSTAIADCDCGKKDVLVRISLLKENRIKSCGCLRRERAKTLSDSCRVNFGVCRYCGSEKLYAKNLCRLCYQRQLNNNGIITPTRKERAEMRAKKVLEPKPKTVWEIKRDKFAEEYSDVVFHTERQKEIYEMYTEQKLSISEIGRRLNISRQAVSVILKEIKRLKHRHYENFILNKTK